MPNYIYQNIVRVPLSTELDVVLAYKRARQLSEMTGITIPGQTKFSTAVSEICRNVIEYVGDGSIQFSVVKETERLFIEARIVDYGRGIANVDQYLNRKNGIASRRGWGIANSRKLVDRFSIRSEPDQGTQVQLLMRIPAKHPPINKSIIEGWKDFFAHEAAISPYEEIKQQNLQLLEVMESLRLKGIETENQLDEIKKLNEELEKSNLSISQLLQEREENNQLLQKMNHELEQFAYTVSHDLKAPLKNITGLVALLKKRVDLTSSPKAQEPMELLQDQATRMENLITSILNYSRTGLESVPKTSVKVEEVIAGVLRSINAPACFLVRIDSEFSELETEEIYLQQIFGNLIGNAIKYHDKGEGTITIRAKKEEELYTFCVVDDGPGIPLKHKERVFDRFYTTGNSSDQESTGLGLSIVKKIVTEKGGKVWVESEGRGSSFYFTWPT